MVCFVLFVRFCSSALGHGAGDTEPEAGALCLWYSIQLFGCYSSELPWQCTARAPRLLPCIVGTMRGAPQQRGRRLLAARGPRPSCPHPAPQAQASGGRGAPSPRSVPAAMNPDVLLRILCHRADHAASKFLKKARGGARLQPAADASCSWGGGWGPFPAVGPALPATLRTCQHPSCPATHTPPPPLPIQPIGLQDPQEDPWRPHRLRERRGAEGGRPAAAQQDGGGVAATQRRGSHTRTQ